MQVAIISGNWYGDCGYIVGDYSHMKARHHHPNLSDRKIIAAAYLTALILRNAHNTINGSNRVEFLSYVELPMDI